MPFKFKLGRKKSSSPAGDASNHAESGATSSFRVIPRSGPSHKKGVAVKDKPLPQLGQHGRKWSEEDTSSSNRASDSTSSTNKSRPFGPHAYDQSLMAYGDSNAQADGYYSNVPSSVSPVDSDRASFLEMPATFSSQEGFGQMFRGIDDKPNAAAPESPRFETPARPSRYSKVPPFQSGRSGDLHLSPLSLQSRSTDEVSLSPSFAVPAPQEQGPPPPAHVSPPVKIQNYDVMRDVVSPSFSDEIGSDSWDPPVLKRIDSTESFTRSVPGIDADARLVRSSVLIRRDTTDSQEFLASSPLRPNMTKRLSSLHPPAQNQSQFNPSTSSSKSPSISSTASSQGQTLSDVSVTPKPTTQNTPQRQAPSNTSTPRAAPAKTTIVDSDSDDEPLANTLQRISSNPRLSVIPAPTAGSRLSVVPPEDKRLSKFDTLRPVSIVSGASDTSQDRSRPSSDLVSNPSSRPLSAQALVEDGVHINGASTASQKASASDALAHGRSASDNENKLSDDDDDVPLALLPAANSPVRGRLADSRLGQHSFPGPGRPGPGYGAPSVAGGRGSLPPFARRLPHDPYGSPEGVLNASRESLLLHRPTNTFPPGQSPVPGMPPGGLVGVIAEEERNKSWRRAAGAGQVGPAGMNAGMSMGMHGPMSIPGLGHGLLGPQQIPPSMVGAEQTQFNQQLVQLVHQQSMMLQQMQAMMQQQQQYAGSVVGYADPEFPQQKLSSPSLRPRSMLNAGLRTQSMVNLNRPPNVPRTMSMISTGQSYSNNWTIGQEPLISSATSIRGMANGYAASVAPSERSTIGQPNRYRPVTNTQSAADTQSNLGGYNRTSMANPPVYGPLAGGDDGEDSVAKKKRSGFFSAMIHPRGRNSTMQAEEDEDWGSFAQKRRSTLSTTIA